MWVPKRANYQYRYGAAQYRYWYPYSNLLVFAFFSMSHESFCYFGQYWQYTSFAVLVLSHLSRVCTGTGIRLMPIPVQACQYQYGHLLGARSSIVILLLTMPVPVQAFWQCPYRYWHPYSNNASTDVELVILPIPVRSYISCPYW
jgi:hypothetical protein